MEVTNGDIYSSRDSLQIMVGMRLPIKVSLQVVKLVSQFNEVLEVVDQVRNRLVNDYGEPNKDGILEVVPPDDTRGRPKSPNFEKFDAEFKELMAQTVEIGMKKIRLPSEVDGKPLQIEPSILMALGKFIDVV